MSEQDQNERRQERANLVNAFSRRVWQPTEQPQLAPRVLAGGVALIVVAGAAFGLGAMNSYNHKKSAEEKARQAALTTRNGSSSSSGNLSRTPLPTAPARGGTAPPSAAPHAPVPPQAAAPQSPGKQRTPGTDSPSPSPSPSEEHVSEKEQRHLAALAAQQGGETAPHMPRAEPATPAKTPAPKGAKAKTSAPAHGTTSKRSSAGTSANMTNVLIRNVKTGKCVDLPGGGNGSAGGAVDPSTCNGSSSDNQLWDLVVSRKGAGPSGSDLFAIRNSKDGYCLDVPGTGAAPSKSKVSESSCVAGSGDNQMWYLDKKASGEFWVRNSSSGGLCLDISGNGGSGIKDPWISIYPCSLNDDHLWSFS